MTATPSGRVGELVAQIERYLAAHPSACDTAQGVRQSWLSGTDAPVQEVSAALEHLIQLGKVERLSKSGGTVFRANRAG
jgi:hypothetical protein